MPDLPQTLEEDPLADYTYSPSLPTSPATQQPITESLISGAPQARRAKRLYYPGTQGGFASVGSGIGGQQNMLDDLLKKLQG